MVPSALAFADSAFMASSHDKSLGSSSSTVSNQDVTLLLAEIFDVTPDDDDDLESCVVVVVVFAESAFIASNQDVSFGSSSGSTSTAVRRRLDLDVSLPSMSPCARRAIVD